MSLIPNPRVLYTATPTASFIPGQHTKYDDTPTINLRDVPLNGGFLTKTLMLSVDTVIRARMSDRSAPNYTTTMHVGSS
jgi:NADPH-dependent curcumin reductase CurA